MEFFVTPSGTMVGLRQLHAGPARHDDAYLFRFALDSTGGISQPVTVMVDQAPMLPMTLQQNSTFRLTPETRPELARAAVLFAVDQDPDALGAEVELVVDVRAENVLDFVNRPKLTNRALRRFIARRAYSHWSHQDMEKPLAFTSLDFLITGASHQDFLRNAQVLAEEGYLKVHVGPTVGEFRVVPRAPLIRDVERYGSAREDAVSESQYKERVRLYPVLATSAEQLLLERQRYASATTFGELSSVFRATTPIVEDLLRQLLRSHGSQREYPSLGPIIADLKNRSIADQALLASISTVPRSDNA